MAAESFLISTQGLSTQAAGLPFFLLTDVRICSDAQVAGELGILDRNQRAKGEPFADGSGVDRPAVAASGSMSFHCKRHSSDTRQPRR